MSWPKGKSRNGIKAGPPRATAPTPGMLRVLAEAEAVEVETKLTPSAGLIAERLDLHWTGVNKHIRGLKRFGLWRWPAPSPGQRYRKPKPRGKAAKLAGPESGRRQKAKGGYGKGTVESLEEWRKIAAPWIHGVR